MQKETRSKLEVATKYQKADLKKKKTAIRSHLDII